MSCRHQEVSQKEGGSYFAGSHGLGSILGAHQVSVREGLPPKLLASGFLSVPFSRGSMVPTNTGSVRYLCPEGSYAKHLVFGLDPGFQYMVAGVTSLSTWEIELHALRASAGQIPCKAEIICDRASVEHIDARHCRYSF